MERKGNEGDFLGEGVLKSGAVGSGALVGDDQ